MKPDASPDRAPGPPERPLDERVFTGVLVGAVVVIVAAMLFSQARSRRAAAAERRGRMIEFATAQGLDVRGRHRELIDFALTDRTGLAVRRADLQGQWLVVNFVFTGCSLSCLKVNYRMAEIQKLVADQPDVRLVSLTVDPQSDSPASLAKFADRFGAQTNRWLFLTGDKRMVHELIGQSFLGTEDPALAGLIPGGWNQIDRIALVDPEGTLRGLFDGMRPDAAREVVITLEQLKRARAR